jgi:hypothetical protein
MFIDIERESAVCQRTDFIGILYQADLLRAIQLDIQQLCTILRSYQHGHKLLSRIQRCKWEKMTKISMRLRALGAEYQIEEEDAGRVNISRNSSK